MSRKGPESKFREKIRKELEKCNAKIYPLLGGMQQVDDRIYSQMPGMADTIVVHPYTGIVFLEFKAANGVVSPVQERFLREVNDRVSYSAWVVKEKSDNLNHSLILLQKSDNFSSFIWYFEDGKDLIRRIREIKTAG